MQKFVLKNNIGNNYKYRVDKDRNSMKKKIFITFLAMVYLPLSVLASGGLDETKMRVNQMKDGQSLSQPDFQTEKFHKKYKHVTKDGVVMQAMELMNSVNISKYSYNALMGNNLTERPFKIEFKNLSDINPEYASFDALGWQKADKINRLKETLYIYINEKHRNAPPEAIAALLAHEAIHQDKFASLNEETYAWTLEAATWVKMLEKNPDAANSASSLVSRENMLKKLFEKGDYTNKYIKKAVYTNPGYKRLPSRSPGFEDENL